MTTAEELKDSLESFAESCNQNERLTAMIKDWNRILHIQASDLGKEYTLATSAGAVSVSPGLQDTADLVIQSTAEILTQVFYGELSPNEPYNAGTLRIQGPEEDIVRLDFVIAMLWE
jgi:putative sterol carrier protein